MKNLLLLTSIFYLSLTTVHAQSKESVKRQSVEKTVTDFFQGIADRDTIELKKYCRPDILILEHFEIWNLDTLIYKISQPVSPDFKRINSFGFIETKIKGKIAWTTYHNQADVTRNGKSTIIKWLETAILIKEKGAWKMKMLRSSLIERG